MEIKNVTLEEIMELIEEATQKECDIEEFEGVLIDNYVIMSYLPLEFHEYEAKYIICLETYINTWSSSYTVIMTDDISILEKHMNKLLEEK